MTTLDRGEEKLKFEDLPQHYDQNDISGYCSLNSEKAESPVTPNISRTGTTAAVASVVSNAGTPPSLDEKRMRREIANSNERRRMQSINAGFQSLRTLLPHHEGEKLSKAAILQQTAEYIYQLEQERTQLLQQNCHLKRIISQHEGELASNSPPSPGGVPSKKRKTTDSSDEEVVVPLLDDREGLRMQLDRERALRIHLEEKVARLESIYPIATAATAVTTTEKLHENISAADQITIQFKDEPKEETIILSSSKGGPGIPQSLENGRRIATEIHLQQSSANIVNVVTETKSQRVAATSGTTSVILQPVTHEESLLPSAIINGHQYAVSPTAAVLPVAGKPSKPKVEVERLPSPTSVSLTTTIAATRLTNTSTSNSSTRLLSTNTSPSHQIEQMSPVSASTDVFTIQSHSRQNLEAIVEAIRHLEGDSAFDSASTPSSCSSSSSNISINSDSSCNSTTTTPSTTTATGTTGRSPISASAPNQEAPLALTKRTAPHTVLQVDMNHMNSFVRFNPRHHTSASGTGTVTTNEQQQRPGVIVVKQQT